MEFSYFPYDVKDKSLLAIDVMEEIYPEYQYWQIAREMNALQMEKDLPGLSAGQKKKVLLAKSICEPKHLHIWDEPMNYIDVISRMQIEELLLSFQPTILFVEHDRAFCENVATKVVELA